MSAEELAVAFFDALKEANPDAFVQGNPLRTSMLDGRFELVPIFRRALDLVEERAKAERMAVQSAE